MSTPLIKAALLTDRLQDIRRWLDQAEPVAHSLGVINLYYQELSRHPEGDPACPKPPKESFENLPFRMDRMSSDFYEFVQEILDCGLWSAEAVAFFERLFEAALPTDKTILSCPQLIEICSFAYETMIASVRQLRSKYLQDLHDLANGRQPTTPEPGSAPTEPAFMQLRRKLLGNPVDHILLRQSEKTQSQSDSAEPSELGAGTGAERSGKSEGAEPMRSRMQQPTAESSRAGAPNPVYAFDRTWQKGYLGLIWNEETREVGRVNMHITLDLSASRIYWCLLMFFIKKRTCRSIIDDIMEVWADVGRAENPKEGTVVSTISEINKYLIELKVKIVNIRNMGYVLEEWTPENRVDPS
jgi:hypothetical protein